MLFLGGRRQRDLTKYDNHNGRHRDTNAVFHQRHPPGFSGIGTRKPQRRIVEKVITAENADETDARVDENPQARHRVRKPPWDDLLQILKPEHQSVENKGSRQDDSTLESSSGPELTVRNDIEPEDQNKRDGDFGDHA